MRENSIFAKIVEEVEENIKKLDSCTLHDFVQIKPSAGVPVSGLSNYRCTKCEGNVGTLEAGMYMKGLEHGKQAMATTEEKGASEVNVHRVVSVAQPAFTHPRRQMTVDVSFKIKELVDKGTIVSVGLYGITSKEDREMLQRQGIYIAHSDGNVRTITAEVVEHDGITYIIQGNLFNTAKENDIYVKQPKATKDPGSTWSPYTAYVPLKYTKIRKRAQEIEAIMNYIRRRD